MKLWQKKSNLNKTIEGFTVGNDYLLDKNLIEFDCIASIAHAEMLFKTGFLDKKECTAIKKTLKQIIKLNSKGNFKIKKEDEDCHTAIENFLVKKLGKTGKKIHCFRSRNDQIYAAIKLYSKKETKKVIELSKKLIKEMVLFKNKNKKINLPGYTHMRKAMPSSVGLWIQAFIDSMKDNIKLLEFTVKLNDQNPLGSGAGYGVPIKIDKKLTAKLLSFSKVQNNPVYVQNSRGKFEAGILHALNQMLFDLNKMSSDLILFSMEEFGFFELSEEICTGSSIMPNKKNPDVLEILRAKYHENLALEFQIKSISSNLISGYNRDLQLTKEPLMQGIENTKSCLKAMKIVLEHTKANKENCEKALTEEIFSAEKAINLTAKGMPFRTAYMKVKSEL